MFRRSQEESGVGYPERITEKDLLAVYEQVKERCGVILTTTDALDDGFTVDCPIIVGQAHGQSMWLYAYEDMFVMDVMDGEKTKGTHWHPHTVEDAVRDMAEFMDGKRDYRLRSFGV